MQPSAERFKAYLADYLRVEETHFHPRRTMAARAILVVTALAFARLP